MQYLIAQGQFLWDKGKAGIIRPLRLVLTFERSYLLCL